MSTNYEIDFNSGFHSANQAGFDWAKDRLSAILTNIQGMGLINKGALFMKTRYYIGLQDGMIEKISFRFPTKSPNLVNTTSKWNRSAYFVFVEKGVGRGRPIGSSKVRPYPFFNKELNERHINNLASSLAEAIGADIEINAKRVLIK